MAPLSLKVAVVFFMACILQNNAFKLRSRHASISMMAASKSADNFQTVLSDVVKVITTTGPRQGLTRSLQVGNAVSKLSRQFVVDQKSFQNDDGGLSVPKTIKRLFEELGATYIKLGQFIASSPTLFPAEFVQQCAGNIGNT